MTAAYSLGGYVLSYLYLASLLVFTWYCLSSLILRLLHPSIIPTYYIVYIFWYRCGFEV